MLRTPPSYSSRRREVKGSSEVSFIKLLRKKKKTKVEKMLIAALVMISVSTCPDKKPQEVFDIIRKQSRDYS